MTAPATSGDPTYQGVVVADVTVTNTDNDAAGVTVTPTTGLTTTEAGGTATFTVVLTSQPTADVTIALSSSDTTEGTVSPASLTFTTANWNIPHADEVEGRAVGDVGDLLPPRGQRGGELDHGFLRRRCEQAGAGHCVEAARFDELQHVGQRQPVVPRLELRRAADHVVVVVHDDPRAHVLEGPPVDRDHGTVGAPARHHRRRTPDTSTSSPNSVRSSAPTDVWSILCTSAR